MFLKVSYHEDLQNNEIILENVTGDGNCYYRTISHFLFGMQDYHDLIRIDLYNYINNKREELVKNNPYVDYFGTLYHIDDYINLIKQNKFYAGDLEVTQSPHCFNINIAVYSFDSNTNKYNHQVFYTNNKNYQKVPLLKLNYDNNMQHYQILYYNNTYQIK